MFDMQAFTVLLYAILYDTFIDVFTFEDDL